MKVNIAFVIVNLLCAWYNFYGELGWVSPAGGGFNCFVAGFCGAFALVEWSERRMVRRMLGEIQ